MTAGDFIVVFDADFAPRPDFLWETLPYMDDPTVGVVQTAQFFDVDKRVNSIARFAGSLQELFFRWIQPARDTVDAAICAGTNVVYRRHAVSTAGGFAEVPIGEDVHSGVKLWDAGFKTRYVPLCLAKGIAPDSFDALANQQYRWCRSSMLLMLDKHFRSASFSVRQRTCFWAAFLYYMASAAIPVTCAIPGIFMLWFFPADVHAGNYLPVVPGLFATFVVFPALARGWSLSIYRVCMINSFCHLLACSHALKGHVEAWVPTGAAKGTGAKVPDKIARMLGVWFVSVQLLLWGGIARDLLIGGYSFWAYAPAIALACFQIYMLAPMWATLSPKTAVAARRFVPALANA